MVFHFLSWYNIPFIGLFVNIFYKIPLDYWKEKYYINSGKQVRRPLK